MQPGSSSKGEGVNIRCERAAAELSASAPTYRFLRILPLGGHVLLYSALLCCAVLFPTFVNVQQSCQVRSDRAACQGGCLMRMQTPSQPRFHIVLFGTILHPFVMWWVAAEMEARLSSTNTVNWSSEPCCLWENTLQWQTLTVSHLFVRACSPNNHRSCCKNVFLCVLENVFLMFKWTLWLWLG